MSSKALSPGATLFRHSRLAAMPPPLPSSANRGNPHVSIHPTMQAIASPRSSAYRGNWGLKRDLPLAPSQKTQFMKYRDLDTINHMTTFQSAQEDVFTLKKWQEMDIALAKGMEFWDTDPSSTRNASMQSVYPGTQSVFDGKDGAPEGYKWRHEGPYVQNMTQGELKVFIRKYVKPREKEFLGFVSRAIIEEDAKDRKQKASEEERKEALENPEQLQEVDIQSLRSDLPSLQKYVVQFLDIPVIAKPHMTHPSAGLHYTRSNSHVRFDPELGPQENRKEVPGRDLNYGRFTGQVAGVGGIAAKVQQQGYYDPIKMTRGDRLDIKHYRPVKASIDPQGRVMLEVHRVSMDNEELNTTRGEFAGNQHWRAVYPQEEAVDEVQRLLDRMKGKNRPRTGGMFPTLTR